MPRSQTAGVLAMFLSGLSFALMAAIVKVVSYSHTPPSFDMILFFESFVALVLVLLYYNLKLSQTMKTARPWTHMLRGFFGLLMVFTGWISVKYLPVADAVILHNTAPLYLPILGFFVFRSKMRPLVAVPIIVGFIGVVWIANPGEMTEAWPVGLAAGSGLAFAFVLTVSKSLAKTEPSGRIVFYYFLCSTVVTGFGLIWFWEPTTTENYLLMLALGVLFVGVQVPMNIAIQVISPLLCSMLFYSCVVFGFLIDLFYWNIKPGLWQFVGLVTIVLMSIWAIYLNRPVAANVSVKAS